MLKSMLKVKVLIIGVLGVLILLALPSTAFNISPCAELKTVGIDFPDPCPTPPPKPKEPEPKEPEPKEPETDESNFSENTTPKKEGIFEKTTPIFNCPTPLGVSQRLGGV
jgi:hypothetical protein